MKRSDIKGFTFRFFNKIIEVVTIKHALKTIAVYNKDNRKLLKRIEL